MKLLIALFLATLCPQAWASAIATETPRPLVASAPGLSQSVADRAMSAVECAKAQGTQVEKLVVVDMSLPSKQKRLWAFTLQGNDRSKLLINARVAHGAGSDRNGDGKADAFSNTANSHMTSLGLYKIAERYQGKHGWSRRLDGLFARFNSRARDRAVVIHPSSYVRADRVGRSHGCPAVSQETMDTLEKVGLSNTVLWIDGPDEALAAEVAKCSRKRTKMLTGPVA